MEETLIERKQYNAARLSAIMNNLVRYCTTPSLIKESVSDHSFLISLLIIEASTEYKDLFKHLNLESLLIRATLHDLVETVTGDIPSPAKRAIPEYSRVFEEIEEATANNICQGRSNDFRRLLLKSIKFDDDDVLEEVAFKVFDYFCVLLKASNELYLGNKFYKRVVIEMKEVINNLREKVLENSFNNYDFLELLTYIDDEVITLLNKLINKIEKM